MKCAVLRITLMIIAVLCSPVGSISAADEKVWVTPQTNSDFQVHFEGTSIPLRMVYIKDGTFLMGQPLDEKPRYEWAIEPIPVTVKSFWIGATEVTNGMFHCFDPKHYTREFKGITLDRDRQPVVDVSYFEAWRFCEWLSEKTGRNFRLPTEAEWEYACRAGTTTARYWGDRDADAVEYESLWTLEEFNKFRPNAVWILLSFIGSEPQLPLPHLWVYDGFASAAPVASFKPNPWGLYDMLGNVSEMCSPAYDLKKLLIANKDCIYRGGSWHDDSWSWVRCGSRAVQPARWRFISLGFRVVCSEDKAGFPIPENGIAAEYPGPPDMPSHVPASLIKYYSGQSGAKRGQVN